MAAITSPCNKICTVDPAAGICVGCGRTLDEIASWPSLNENERAAVMAELPQRISARSATLRARA